MNRLIQQGWVTDLTGLGQAFLRAAPLLFFVGFLFLPQAAFAARIGDVSETSLWEQALRFFSFRDPSVRVALAGCMLLGVCCGLLGTMIVVRQFALAGDTLAHAVLPGIALGYLWALKKSVFHLFLGAVVAGVIGAVVVSLIQQTTRIKRDTALGLVLGGFYGFGILLVTLVQNHMPGEISGLKSFLFGSAAALNESDLFLIAVITLTSAGLLIFFFRQFRIVSFDPTFARSIGIPERLYHYTLMLLLAWAVVAALQAVGVVLVSAMLVIPAGTAYLLTDRLHRMMILSVVLGVVIAAVGAFFSFLGPNLPTGPFIVLTGAVFFFATFAFAPRQGLLAKWWQRRKQAQQIARENVLKAIYHLQEADGFRQEWVPIQHLEDRRQRGSEEVSREIDSVLRSELIERQDNQIRFTETGQRRAREIVRNHRLWELYLTNEANIAADHVHDDAEKIEHILGEDIVRQLEASLEAPDTDPHGKEIPTTPG